jgi:hypothetical protein
VHGARARDGTRRYDEVRAVEAALRDYADRARRLPDPPAERVEAKRRRWASFIFATKANPRTTTPPKAFRRSDHALDGQGSRRARRGMRFRESIATA